MMSGFYKNYVVETFYGSSESSKAEVRVRPIAGQGLPISMRVECSRSMRKAHPVGSKFLIQAVVTDKEGGKPFLYSHYNSAYQVLTDEEAANYLKKLSK